MFKSILRGIIIGIANVMPGISGGTMAVSMGIYEQLIYSVNNLQKDIIGSLKILLPVIFGAIIGCVCLSFLIEYMFSAFPVQTNMLFIGLISGGLPSILKKVENTGFKVGYLITFIMFFGFFSAMALMGDTGRENAALSVSIKSGGGLFFAGLTASAAMVIPGVSGSMLLMLMGYYEPIIVKINNILRAAAAFDFNTVFLNFIILLPFGLGCFFGILIIARVVGVIFTRFTAYAYWAVIGLIFASPVAIVFSIDFSSFGVWTVAASAAAFGIGFYSVYALGEK